MAENVSPASDPRSLRRHYPHQVQGVVQLDLSAIAAPPHFYLVENKTAAARSQRPAKFGRQLWMSLQIWNVIVIRRMKRSETP